MGKCFAADKRGRYEEKGGGTEVGSFFRESTENEKLKAVYGNYCLWAWLRYWWLDTENYITLMLADKGYHDYDYTEPKVKRELTKKQRKIWSDDKIASILGRAINPISGKRIADEQAELAASSEHEIAERIQREIRKDKRLDADMTPDRGT